MITLHAKERARARLEYLRKRKRVWKADRPSFAADALKIRPKDGALRRFIFNSVQRNLDAALDAQRAELGMVRAIVLKARQMGVSTYVNCRFYHRMRHDPGYRTLIMTHREDATDNLAGMIKRFHEHDPDPPPLVARGKSALAFANDSAITVATAGAQVTGTGVSFTHQLGHLSELALWQSASAHLTGIFPTFPDVPGSEIIIESTARGVSGPFYQMAQDARRGQGDYILLFYPWFEHETYSRETPAGWVAPEEFREMGEEFKLTREQLYWAYVENMEFAALDGSDRDEVSWRFRQEYPATIDEAFRAGRKGGFVPSSIVAKARARLNPLQADMPLIIGCDFATGGGGGDSEQPDSSVDRADGVHGTEDGDANVFIARRGRSAGRELYDRFRDRNTLSVANRLQEVIGRLHPDRVFMDRGGGGAAVFDILCDRGYGRILELVDFGSSARPVDERRYRNKRAEMYGEMRDWIADEADVPDEDLLETEITAPWVHSEDERGLTLAPKKEIRHKLKLSPDGADALATTFAAPVRKQARIIRRAFR